jgi:transposase
LAKIDAKKRKSNAGRKPTDRILMFKLLILQRMNGLADERLEFQVADRLSFMRFLGLDLGAAVPDARTVWAFREELKEHDLVDELFATFNQAFTPARTTTTRLRVGGKKRLSQNASMCALTCGFQSMRNLTSTGN